MIWLYSLLACAPEPSCRPIVLTDIDETLTTFDREFLNQIIDGSLDPEMRPDANTLMQGYADRGFRVVYVTARGEDLNLSDGRSARVATVDWLTDHGFPFQPEDVFLYDGLLVTGDDTVTCKTDTIQAVLDQGAPALWAYGNADTDVLAYQAVGIPDDHIFLVGELAGTMGVNPITTEDAYTAHLPQLDTELGRCAL